MLRRCAQISLTCPRRICKLFDALELPILSYGCEVWFWDHRAGTQATRQLESLHAQFLRTLLGIHTACLHLLSSAGIPWQCIGSGKWTGSDNAFVTLSWTSRRSPCCGLCMMASATFRCAATAPWPPSVHYRHMAAQRQPLAKNSMSSASGTATPPPWPPTCRCRSQHGLCHADIPDHDQRLQAAQSLCQHQVQQPPAAHTDWAIPVAPAQARGPDLPHLRVTE